MTEEQTPEDRLAAAPYFNAPIGASDGDMSGEWLQRRMDHVEGALREVDIKLRCSKCYRDDCLSVAFWRSGEPTTVCNECGRDDEATNLEIEAAS